MAPVSVPVTLGAPRFRSVEAGGFLVTEARFAAGELAPHFHDRACLAVILEGSFEVRFAGKNLHCPPSTFLCEPAGEKHANRFGNTGARVVVVQPSAAGLERLRAEGSWLDGIHCDPASPAAALGWRLAHEMRAPDKASALAIEGLALEMLAEAARVVSPVARGPKHPPSWLARVLEVLHARCREHVGLEELAAEAGVHPTHLTRVFRQHHGVSIGSYVRRLRLDWARREVVRSQDSLASLALRAGFADQSHFTRAFKRHTGLTPDRYRRQAGGDGSGAPFPNADG